MQEYTIRNVRKNDFDQILSIENESFPNPWNIDDFKSLQISKTAFCSVLECDDEIRGYIVYEKNGTQITISNIAVSKIYRKCGYGRALMNVVLLNLNKKNCNLVYLYVIETNVGAQLFLQKCGFIAKKIINNYFPKSRHAAYLMIKEAKNVD